MSSMIPLMGKQPDIVNALAGGARAAALTNQVQQTNRLRELYANQGAGIVAGDPSAMNALAAVDPRLAHSMQMDRQNQQRADARLGIAQEQLQMQRNAVARALAEAEDQAEAQREAREAVMMGNKAMAALQAGDERAWGMMTREFTDGTPLPMTREGVATLQSIVTGSADYMAAMPQQRGPQSSLGKIQADIDAGMLPPDTPLRRTTPETVIQMGGAPASEQASPQASPAQPQDILDPEDVRQAFGLQGRVRGAANAAADFLGAGLVDPGVQKAQSRLNKLNTDAMLTLSAAYPGRPSNLTREKIESMLPSATGGPESALNNLNEVIRTFEQQIAQVQQSMASGGLSGGDLSQAVTFTNMARSLLGQYQQYRDALQGGAAAPQKSDVDLMNELLSQ